MVRLADEATSAAGVEPKACACERLVNVYANLIDAYDYDGFATLWAEGGSADAVIEAKGLKQISDSGAIEKIVDEVLAANPKSVEEFRAGKEKAFNALVGQVMKASKGKANPAQAGELLRRKLG